MLDVRVAHEVEGDGDEAGGQELTVGNARQELQEGLQQLGRVGHPEALAEGLRAGVVGLSLGAVPGEEAVEDVDDPLLQLPRREVLSLRDLLRLTLLPPHGPTNDQRPALNNTTNGTHSHTHRHKKEWYLGGHGPEEELGEDGEPPLDRPQITQHRRQRVLQCTT